LFDTEKPAMMRRRLLVGSHEKEDITLTAVEQEFVYRDLLK
jgi:hypothetical protein